MVTPPFLSIDDERGFGCWLVLVEGAAPNQYWSSASAPN